MALAGLEAAVGESVSEREWCEGLGHTVHCHRLDTHCTLRLRWVYKMREESKNRNEAIIRCGR